jgi:hypothetical protein
VTFNCISPEASTQDANPISIVGQGWEFSTPGYEKEAVAKAQRCHRTFINICMALEPEYAAILNEDSLSCQFDLRLGRGRHCFRNFFLSQRKYGISMLDRVEAMYSDAYTARCPAGLYVATWNFSPTNVKLDPHEAKRRSEMVTQMIAESE